MYCWIKKISVLLWIGLFPLSGLAAATDGVWPGQAPISYVVPYPPGGSTDILARNIGRLLSEKLGASVVVENRAGATGTIGSGYVARAKPDGHTVLHTTTGPQSIVSHFRKLPYDPIKSLEPVIMVGTFPHVLLVNSESPYHSVSDLTAAAKNKPNSLTFGSAGAGTILHMQGELLKLKTGITATHIPYKGDTPVLQAVMSGEVTFAFVPIVSALAQLEGGKLRAIAVTSEKRMPNLKDVPTMAEQGVADFVVVQWQGVYVPAGTPKEVVTSLNRDINTILNNSKLRELASGLKIDLIGGSPKQLADKQLADYDLWGRVIGDANIRID